MAVRRFKESDFPAVCRVYIDAKRDELASEHGDFKIIPLDDDPVIMAALRESDVVVYESEEVVGFAAIFGSQLRALFVHSAARGKGVGNALLTAALACAPESISLYVAKSNLSAMRFYVRNGFSVVGEAIRQYSGIDVVYAKMSYRAWSAASG
jgi:putative acetyltransferase